MYSAQAQLLPLLQDTAEAVVEVPPALPPDSLGRTTPRGAVEGFIDAVAEENYARAARYIQLDSTLTETEAASLAQALQRLLDHGGNILPISWLSNKPEGITGDDMVPELERVGTATVNDEEFDLMLQQSQAPDGGMIWQFSSQTVNRIPLNLEETVTPPLVDTLLPDLLLENRWAGVPAGHWLLILVLVAVSYILAKLITLSIKKTVELVWAKASTDPTAGIIKAFALPVRLYLAVWIFVASSRYVGISIVLRQSFSELTVIVGLVALLLLLWRLVDSLTSFGERRLTRRGNMAGISAILFLRRGIKFALIAFGVIAALGTIGVDITTGLAALGIGGIALALGAQKTIENFVGSVTLIADQPIRVGDFCKVGEVVGTVEQIGMRSTRIRTLDRTVVTIPNGEFSSQSIENYARRDRFWFHPTLGLRYETTPDQIRYLLVELRAILYAHPKVSPDPARVRFVELGADSLNLELFAYVHASDFNEYLEIKEDLLLRIMDVVAASGSGFAFPSQTIYFAKDEGLSEEKSRQAEEQVREWREKGEMQIPNFDYSRIQDLRNTIVYPANGNGAAK